MGRGAGLPETRSAVADALGRARRSGSSWPGKLGKRSTGSTFYLLDEPTTGLHFADVHKLIDVLQGFVTAGNTVLVVEHSLDVVKVADWVIDMGPDGGAGGGRVVCAGTPEDVAACEESDTGRALRDVLPGFSKRESAAPKRAKAGPRKTPADHGEGGLAAQFAERRPHAARGRR